MTDDRIEPTPEMSRALMRGMTQRRLSRRQLIKVGGVSVGALSLSSILAACGKTETGSGTGTTGSTVDFSATPGSEINFANWPLYIDKATNADGDRYSPSLDSFTKANDITVNYETVINSNDSFFGKLLPQLEAGQDTGWDIIVITNGRELTALIQNEWVTELDPSMRPNFDANAAPFAKDPVYDPGNKFSMAWQSGTTGIGYDTTKVSAPITTMDDLMNPDLVGTASVGMLKQDMPDLVMINLGIDPADSTPEDWKAAAAWIQKLKDSGTVRTFYDQGYIDDLVAGNLSATMAWSGDVLYYKIWEGYPFEFVIPEGGALLWIDNMLIPVGAKNPQGAYKLMDYYYDPEVAQDVTEWVAYMSPVPAVQGLIADHAKEEKDPDTAAALAAMAESPFLWPDDAMLSQLKFGREFTTDDEREEWDSIFIPLTES
ncbi:MAG TPA: spermidine/putrescine ABC transporter substrate-binding protein [Actinomycetota bacterium]|jgi:spermidine/putrescine transport system substrate-binding protein|nr:spermidine/putrescine ABC transporter substrate-binding protein [Actinomycetota bacterium]